MSHMDEQGFRDCCELVITIDKLRGQRMSSGQQRMLKTGSIEYILLQVIEQIVKYHVVIFFQKNKTKYHVVMYRACIIVDKFPIVMDEDQIVMVKTKLLYYCGQIPHCHG